MFLVTLLFLKISINGQDTVECASIADAVSQLGIKQTDVKSIRVTDGVVSQTELRNGTTRLVSVYKNLVNFSMSEGASIQDNLLPMNSFRASNIENVEITTLVTIGESVFYNSTKLKTFVAPNVELIGLNSFRFCSSLTTLKFPKCLRIKNYAFMASGLASIEIPNVEILGNNVFHECWSLTELHIPKCTFADTECFRESGLVSIELPPNISFLGAYAFWNCSNLAQEFTFTSLRCLKMGTFLNCFSLTKVVADLVELVDSMCFKCCDKLSEVSFQSLETIGYEAFYHTPLMSQFDMLKTLYIEPWAFYQSGVKEIMNSKLLSLGSQAFRDCVNLEEASIASVSSVERQAFDNCTSLCRLEISNASHIMDYGFRNCVNLVSVSLPRGTFLGNSTFEGCTKLQSVESSDIAAIGNFSFKGCTVLTTNLDDNPVEYIGESAFEACENLPSAHYSRVEFVGSSAFKGCTKMQSFIADGENLTFDSHAFYGCTALSTFTAPTTRKVGSYGFSGTAITSLHLPELTYLGDYACQECKQLQKVFIGEKCTFIGFSMFWGCTSLRNASLICNADLSQAPNMLQDAPLEYLALSTFSQRTVLNLYSKKEDIVVEIGKADGYCPTDPIYNVTSYVTTIGSHAFSNCESITTFSLSKKINEIKDYAFEGVTGLTEMTFPSIPELSEGVFHNCENLVSVKLPDTITVIGDHAFSGCVSLSDISCPKKVTSIGSCAFEDTQITTVTLPSTLQSLGEEVFKDCHLLRSVTVETELISGTKKDVFGGCVSLEELRVPWTFKEMASELSGSVNVILYKRNTCPVDSYRVPDFVTEVSASAMEQCDDLTTVTITKRVRKIGENAFYKSSKIYSVVFEEPSSVMEIGSRAMSGLPLIQAAPLPVSLVSVGDSVLSGDSKLETIYVWTSFDVERYRTALTDGNDATIVFYEVTATPMPSETPTASPMATASMSPPMTTIYTNSAIPSPDEDEGLSVVVITGIAAGGVIALAIVAIVIYIVIHKTEEKIDDLKSINSLLAGDESYYTPDQKV